MPAIRRIKDNYHAVGLIDSSENYTKLAKYCTRCLGFGVRAALGVKVNALLVDIDKFLQCPNCGTTVPKYEVKSEPVLDPVIEARDNPFDTDEIKGVERRKRKKGRGTNPRVKQRDEIDDDDLKRDLKGGGVLISYSSSGPFV